jgi:hypothetical protein
MATPLEEQIANYKRQFELYAELLPQLQAIGPGAGAYAARLDLEYAYRDKGWDGSRWNWHEDWDGLLVQRLHALEAAGFEVTQFYRKMAIKMRTAKGIGRAKIVRRICEVVGEDWNSISFKRGIYVQWKYGRQWRY